MNSMHVKKGDKVRVLSGKDKGKEGVILRALPQKQRVVVEKVNIAKKAMRPTQQNPQGGIASIEAPIHVSNVMLVCPACKQPSRVSKRINEQGKKVASARSAARILTKSSVGLTADGTGRRCGIWFRRPDGRQNGPTLRKPSLTLRTTSGVLVGC